MAKTAEYYISLGCDSATAEYLASGRKKLVAALPNEDFTLTLDFASGERRLFDCKPLLQKGTVFEPFMDYANFKRVIVDENNNVAWDIDPATDSKVVWNNRVDISADSCYIESTPIEVASSAKDACSD